MSRFPQRFHGRRSPPAPQDGPARIAAMPAAFAVASVVAALGLFSPAETTPLFLMLLLLVMALTMLRWPAAPKKVELDPWGDLRQPPPPRARTFERTLRCPSCGFGDVKTFAAGACEQVFECASCGSRSTPYPMDPCTLCSFGSERCPHELRRGDCA